MSNSAFAQDSTFLKQLDVHEARLGTLFYGGDYPAAVQLSDSILQIVEQTVGQQHELYGYWSDNTGIMLHHAGEREAALPYLETATENTRRYRSPTDKNYPAFFNNLGMLYRDLGRYSEAVRLLQEATSYGKTILGEDDYTYGVFLNNMGLALQDLGQHEIAIDYVLEARDVTERALGKEHWRYAARLVNLANIYRNQNRTDEAVDMLTEAVALYERTLGAKHPKYLNALVNLARAHIIGKRYAPALSLALEAVRLTGEHLGPTSELHFSAVSDLGLVYLYQNDLGQAETVFRQAESMMDSISALRHDWKKNLYYRIALLYEQQNNLVQAGHYYARIANLFIDLIDREFDLLSQRDQEGVLQRYEASLDRFLYFLLVHPQQTEWLAKGLQVQIRRKELTLGYRKQLLSSLSDHTDANLRERFQEWKELHKAISDQLSLPQAKRSEDLTALQQRAIDAERDLATQSIPFRASRQQYDWRQVRANLQPAEVAIEFVHTPYYDGERQTDSVWYGAFIIDHTATQPRLVRLFEASQLGDLRATRSLYRPAANATTPNLHQLVWQPLEPYLADAQTIYLAPTGLLHYINFNAIPCDADRILSECYQLHRLSNTAQLMEPQFADEGSAFAESLVYGGIEYTAAAPAATDKEQTTAASWTANAKMRNQYRSMLDNGTGWPYLSYTAKEAKTVRDLLVAANKPVNLQKGKQATEEHFKNRMARAASPEVVHIATHGFFFPEPNAEASTGFGAEAHPMIRSGLVLAGANAIWEQGRSLPDREDGILTAYEIAQLSLRQTELVVLSACETGLGDIRKNEGVFGLQRAFKLAGTRYLIMSLWSVPDRQTEEFMQLFYTRWLTEGHAIPEAFRLAQNTLRDRYRLPFNPTLWAGFILVE